jgi:hypothetical protein
VCCPAGARPGSTSVGVAASTHGGSLMNRPVRRSAHIWIMSSGQPASPADTALRWLSAAGRSGSANTGGAVAQ